MNPLAEIISPAKKSVLISMDLRFSPASVGTCRL
jgi:hypothetical protein